MQAFAYLRALLPADFMVLLKNKRALIASIVVPVYILFITTREHQSKLGSAAFLVALAVTVGLLSVSIMGYSLIVARDRERGVFQRLRVTPAPTWTIMVSRLLIQVLANLLITVVVLIIGASSLRLSLNAGDYAWTILVSVLAGLVFLAIGQALVGLIRSATMVNAVGSLLYAALLLSGLLGQSEILGATFKNISEWTPVGVIIAVFQSALHQTSWDGTTWLSLLACFGYIVVCTVVGIVWFKWDAQ